MKLKLFASFVFVIVSISLLSGVVYAQQLQSINFAPRATVPVTCSGGSNSGTIYFDSNTGGLLRCNGSSWAAVGGGAGTVTSVGLSFPAQFTISGSPVTGSGTLTGSWASQTANTVLAAPNGVAGTPTFRAVVAADLPASVSFLGTAIEKGELANSGTLGFTWADSEVSDVLSINNGVLYALTSGNVGIGTTGPLRKLDLADTADSSNQVAAQIDNIDFNIINNNPGGVNKGLYWHSVPATGGNTLYSYIYREQSTGKLFIGSQGAGTVFETVNGGNVGIGTTNPGSAVGEKLNVQGTIYSTGDVYGTIFRDQANGSYYLDPANTGTSMNVAGAVNIGGQLYGPAAGAVSSYGSLSVNGSKNGWSGINFRSGASNIGTLMVHPDYQGFFNDADTGWDWYWLNGTLVGGAVPAANITAGTFGGGTYTLPGYVYLPGLLTNNTGVVLCIGTDNLVVKSDNNRQCNALADATPYLFVWDGLGYKIVSDFLFGYPKTSFRSFEKGLTAYKNGAVGEELYVLAVNPAVEKGAYKLKISESDFEKSFIDSLAFFKAAHPADTVLVTDNLFRDVYALKKSELEELIAPKKIKVDGEGRDAVAYLTFSSPGAGKLIFESFLRDNDLAQSVEVAYQNAEKEWINFTKIQPRKPNTTPYIVELPPEINGEFTLRMSGWEGVRVKTVGVLKSFTPQNYTAEKLALESAIEEFAGDDVSSELERKDGVFLRMETGDSVFVKFRDSGLSGEKTSFFVRASGFYVPYGGSDARVPVLSGKIEYVESLLNALKAENKALKTRVEALEAR